MKRYVSDTAAILGILAFVIFSFSFAFTPLFDMFWNTSNVAVSPSPTNNLAMNAPGTANTIERKIPIQFVAENNSGLPWDFAPVNKSMEISPERHYKTMFSVKNRANERMTVQGISNVTPHEAAAHLHKIQCFCFTQQSLNGGESKDMPVVFWVDKDLPSNVKAITLTYSLYNVGNT